MVLPTTLSTATGATLLLLSIPPVLIGTYFLRNLPTNSNMVSLETLRASNAAFKSSPVSKGLVGLFVGATSGIGEHTLKSFARSTDTPRIYLVGRNQQSADRIIKDVHTFNPTAEITFLQTKDLTVLSSCDPIISQIRGKEQKLDVLVMSQGFLSLKGRDGNEEGLDRKMVLHYYSRMRFVIGLLPLLRRQQNDSGFTPQVVSIFSAGRESPSYIRQSLSTPSPATSTNHNLSLSLPGSFSPHTCEAVTVTSTSLAMEHLSRLTPEISYKHIFPGYVPDTNLTSNLPGWARFGAKYVLGPIAGLVIGGQQAEIVGEGTAWLMLRDQLKDEKDRGEEGRENAGKEGLWLGRWDGLVMDWRKVRDRKVGGKDQGRWDEERRGMAEKVWEWLGVVMGRVKSPLVVMPQ